jgi:hypothetical protein
MEIAEVKSLHKYIVEDQAVDAANRILELAGKPRSVTTRPLATKVCRSLFQQLLDNELYLHAATLQWGEEMFNTEPESTVRVFNALSSGSLNLLQGASSMSKTYAAGGYYLLDYLRDPYYTTVKLAAVNEDHLRKNLFAHVATLFRNCAIPSEYNIEIRDSDLLIWIKEAGNEFGITGIAFKQSQETSGQFKGYKPKPVRRVRHPKFGVMSRLRVLGDEGQNWPGGPFKDFNSLTASMTGSDLVKITVAYNPESTSVHVVQLAEPPEGWAEEQLETLFDWESRAGWRVCRLDAARCENVIQRKVVYPGLQTYEGYLSYLKSGGDSSPNYYCFGRGMPPLKGSVNTIIPVAWPQSQRGEATFIENPIVLGAVDLAFMGEDSAQMAVGRWGLASGWRDHMGRDHIFEDRLNPGRTKPRHVLQVDQLLPMEKRDDTIAMGEDIMHRARQLGIAPEWMGVDKTGIGFGTHSHLAKYWGDVVGIAWNEGATESKIMAEDKEGADKQCDGVMSEMWWAFRRWLDPTCCAVLINPIIPTQPLNTQLTSRRYSPGGRGKGIKVESKEVYKARNQHSPDEADAIIMLVHVVRQRGNVLPGLVEQQAPKKGESDLEWQQASKMGFTEADDSISVDGRDE